MSTFERVRQIAVEIATQRNEALAENERLRAELDDAYRTIRAAAGVPGTGIVWRNGAAFDSDGCRITPQEPKP
jgi:hypothetical protein